MLASASRTRAAAYGRGSAHGTPRPRDASPPGRLAPGTPRGENGPGPRRKISSWPTRLARPPGPPAPARSPPRQLAA
ncbi:hypothetical protein M885DRAFT_509511 [Pelagophyceae sp. CCMP2097]|nr:hypothetical protein M885DRAFT_509511 [Pelagophyceae sp. CCMP2097]